MRCLAMTALVLSSVGCLRRVYQMVVCFSEESREAHSAPTGSRLRGSATLSGTVLRRGQVYGPLQSEVCPHAVLPPTEIFRECKWTSAMKI